MASNNQQMHIITQLPSGQGLEPGGWRWPAEDKSAFINEDVFIKGAQLAEKAKLDGFFLVDVPSVGNDIGTAPPQSSLDPMVLMALIAKATERVGLVATMSTSVHEPFTIARVMRSLDLVSHGRMGWNVVTTGAQQALLNYFPGILDHGHKHARSLEVYEAVLRLWGSWPEGGADAQQRVRVIRRSRQNSARQLCRQIRGLTWPYHLAALCTGYAGCVYSRRGRVRV